MSDEQREPVVWADEASPFTGPQVKALLVENEKLRAAAEAAAPTFNHTRGDGVYDPCPICLAKMPREDLLALITDLRSEVWELQACLDDQSKCTGTLVHSEFESCPRCDR